MVIETQGPTLEVFVRVEGSDVAILAAFADGRGGFDLVCGTDDSERFAIYASLVALMVEAARNIESWEDISQLRGDGPEGNETRPSPF